MNKIERIKKLEELNKQPNNSNNDIEKELNFTDYEECYEFIYQNGFVLFTLGRGLARDNYFILKDYEYFVLKYLVVNPNVLSKEVSNVLGIEEKECQIFLDNLYIKKLIEKDEKNLYKRPEFSSLMGTLEMKYFNWIEQRYYLTISKVKSGINIKSDKYSELKELINERNDIKKGSQTKKSELDYKISQLQIEIQINELNLTKKEESAELLFRNHQLDLKYYYDEVLIQSKMIFRWGIGCLIGGGIIIMATIGLIAWKPNTITIGIIGAIGALFTNVIGAIFMNMYTNTIKTLNNFHNRFVGTHHLHFGNLLLSKIEDKETREKAYASIFKDMVISMDKTNDFTK